MAKKENGGDMSPTTTEKIKPFEIKAMDLQNLVNDYKNLVVTRDNLKDADKARLKLREKRLEVQRIEKHNNDLLNVWKKKNGADAMLLVAITEPTEKRIGTDIDKIEAEIELEKTRELNRINTHKKFINDFGQKLIEVMKITDIALLEEKRDLCKAWHASYKAEEFQSEIDTVVSSYLDTIEGLIKIEKSRKPVIEYKVEDSTEVNFTGMEETPYVSNIPKELGVEARKALDGIGEAFETSRGTLSEEVRPVKKEDGTFVDVRTPETPLLKRAFESSPMSEEVFLEKAKQGEFSLSVANNFEYRGYEFYIDAKLDFNAENAIKMFIQQTINDSIDSQEVEF